MTSADRRLEIISILVVSGHTTSKELAQDFHHGQLQTI